MTTLIARRMTYASGPLKGVDLRDERGRLVASCYGHGPEGEMVLQSLLDTFPAEDAVLDYNAIARKPHVYKTHTNAIDNYEIGIPMDHPIPQELDERLIYDDGDREPEGFFDRLARFGRVLAAAIPI